MSLNVKGDDSPETVVSSNATTPLAFINGQRSFVQRTRMSYLIRHYGTEVHVLPTATSCRLPGTTYCSFRCTHIRRTAYLAHQSFRELSLRHLSIGRVFYTEGGIVHGGGADKVVYYLVYLYVPGSGGVFLASDPELNPHLVDFYMTADVILSQKSLSQPNTFFFPSIFVLIRLFPGT